MTYFPVYSGPLPNYYSLYWAPMVFASTMAAVTRRSDAVSLTIRKPRLFLRSLFPTGKFGRDCFQSGSIYVSLGLNYVAQAGALLPFGTWIDLQTGVVGYDLVALVSYLRNVTDSLAVDIILANSEGVSGRKHSNNGRSSSWHQEIFPMQPVLSNWVSALGYDTKVYRNELGVPYMLAKITVNYDGERIASYVTIQKNLRSGVIVVARMNPEPPYQVYNLDCLARQPGAPVIIAENEDQADLSTQYQCIGITAPGGIENIFDTDLAPLENRSVCLCLSRRELPIARRIEQKLHSAGVISISYAVEGKRFVSIDEVELYSQKCGIEILPANENHAERTEIVVPNLSTFLCTSIPVRGYILEYLIPKQGLVLVFAPRGVGKSHVALGIAYAYATGGTFLNWSASEAGKVLYVDGEMSGSDMQYRLRTITVEGDTIGIENLRILTPDLQQVPMPDIGTEDGRSTIDAEIKDASLLVLDNLSTLSRKVSENGGDSWAEIQAWLLDLRRRGISVLVIHHAGKNGEQRGTSRREDVMDTVIQLKHPVDYKREQGARFEVHLTKARNITGDAAKPFEAQLELIEGKSTWTMRPIEDDNLETEACRLFKTGMSVRDVAMKLGTTRSPMGRLRQKLVDDGLLDNEENDQTDD